MGNDSLVFILAFVVVGAAIFVFFVDEWLTILSRFFSVSGATSLFLLIFVSSLLEDHIVWTHNFLLRWQKTIINGLEAVSSKLPFNSVSYPLVAISFLFLLAALPLLMSYGYCKRKRISEPQGLFYRWLFFIWLASALLLICH